MGRGCAVSNRLCATGKWAVMPCLLKIVPVAGTRIPTDTVKSVLKQRSQKRHVGLQKQRTTPFCDPFVLRQGGIFCPHCSIMPVQRAFLACACLLACIGYVHADLLQLAKVRGVQERLYGLLSCLDSSMVATRCYALPMSLVWAVRIQANPSAAYGAWMKLHGKEEVGMQPGCPCCSMLQQSADWAL